MVSSVVPLMDDTIELIAPQSNPPPADQGKRVLSYRRRPTLERGLRGRLEA